MTNDVRDSTSKEGIAKRAINEAFSDESIQRQAEEAALKPEDFARALESKESEFLEAAASEVVMYDRAKAKYKSAQSEYSTAIQTIGNEPQYLSRLQWGIAALLALYVLVYPILGWIQPVGATR